MAKATKGGFIQMPKMMTDEPSVILKLKKGGHVAHKKAKHHEEHEEHGHKSMHHMTHEKHVEHGEAPKKPSMSERRKAMNPNFMKKGGKVAHKAMGGMMPGATPAGMPAPARRPMPGVVARAPVAAPGVGPVMKKGGSAHKAEMHEMHKIEKELKRHEHMKDSAHGGKAHMKHGGKVHHMTGHPEGTEAHHKMMAKHYAEKCKDGGTPHMHKMMEHHKHMAKMCKGGSYASGGAIDKFETKTTIEKKPKKFLDTFMVDGDHTDRAHGTGEVKEKNAGGYKRGGKVHHKFAEGGSTGSKIPSETNKSETRGRIVMGGTVEGNEHYYEDTDMHSSERDSAHGTGGVKMGNGGGFKHGGKAHKKHHYAHGGTIEGNEMKFAIDNVDHTPKGKTNTKTGEVKEANAGGYKRGGHASKKAYATGGDVDMGQADRTLRQSSRGETRMPDLRALNKAAKQMGYEHYMNVPDSRLKEFHELKKKHGYAKGGSVNDEGQAVKMPRHFVSRPVANSLQSGTFKKGGGVKKHYKDGDMVYAPGQDPYNVSPQDYQDAKARAQAAKAYEAASQPDSSSPYQAIKRLLGIGSSTPAPSSQTPAKRRGGRVK